MNKQLSLFFFLLLPCFLFAQQIEVCKVEAGQIWIGEDIPLDSVMESLIRPYREQMAAEMDKIIGFSSVEMRKGQPESLMGNFLCDVLVSASEHIFGEEPDLVLLNYGGLRRSSLPAGNWTLGLLFELLPFENYLVLLSVKGSTLLEMLDLIAKYGGWPVSRSLSLELHNGSASGAIKNVLLANQEILPDQYYTLVTVDYLAQGGDRAAMLMGQTMKTSDQLLREVVLKEIQKNLVQGIPLSSKLDGRIRYAADE
jgi:2',3'-cyclic-nucleotide 2'-phosphodiesterase (5'-nucleotidase family)